jgi:GGDEF domain-containing protein
MRALLQASREAAAGRSPCVVVLAQLEDVGSINDGDGSAAGDRVIVQAARVIQRAAAQTGGTAYRVSGRRLAVLAPAPAGDDADAVLEQVRAEFLGGPRATFALSASQPGERGDEALTRARHALRAAPEAAP